MKAILPILVLLPGVCLGTGVPEPETIFYGKVINRSGPLPYQMTSGTLVWAISRDTESPLEFTVEMRPHSDGEFSYTLSVPHSALALDLEVGQNTIPIGGTSSSHEILSMTVDGHPAVLESGEPYFDVAAARRGSTYRLDLSVNFAMLDSDGDGIPDWWEDLYGLDKQIDDGGLDPDGDGVTNLDEYLAGSDPNLDGAIPVLATSEVTVSDDGISGLHLTTLDTDTPTSQLIYTITSLSSSGILEMRDTIADPESSNMMLEVGSTFTQQQVDEGRLIHVADGSGGDGSIGLSVSDGDPEHEPATGNVKMLAFSLSDPVLNQGTPQQRVELALGTDPLATSEDSVEMRSYILTKDGDYVWWNLAAAERPTAITSPGSGGESAVYTQTYGGVEPQVFIGSPQPDTFAGSFGDDIFIGSPGNDEFTGGNGSDRFIPAAASDGSNLFTDFDLLEADVIDLSHLLEGASTLLSDYVQLTTNASDTVIAFDVNGDGSGFTDGDITLVGTTGYDLYDLWSGGHILTRGLSLPPRIAISGPSMNASENGPSPASFMIELGTPSTAPITVGLVSSGSATSGVDYASLGSSVVIPAGVTEFPLEVVPYQDSISEPNETVRVDLQAGEGYELGSSAWAELTIDDLLPEISITALEERASRATGSPGLFLVERSGVIDRSILVRLQIGGTAVAGSDYASISSYVNLNSGDTTALIEVTPLSGADLTHGVESVIIDVLNHSSYRQGSPDSAEVLLIAESRNFPAWVDQNFPEETSSDYAALGAADHGGHGVANLLRYAFMMNPQKPWLKPAASNAPKLRMIDGRPAIEFTRNLSASDLQWTVEASSNLNNWTSDETYIEDLSETVRNVDARKALYRLADPPEGEEGPSFLRVKVELKP